MEDCCYLESDLRKLRDGEKVKMAVPVYDSRNKQFSYDPRILSENPNKAFEEAIRKLK